MSASLIKTAPNSDGAMETNANQSISASADLKVPFVFKPYLLMDGKEVERAAFEWIDKHCEPYEYPRLLVCGTRAGLGPAMGEYKKYRGMTGFPNVIVDGKQKDVSAFDAKSLVAWAVLRFGFNHEEAISKSKGESQFVFVDGDTYAADFIGGPELIEDVLPAVGVAMVYGESGSGKTFWALDLAFHVHNGAQWRDKDVAAGNAFYIAAEAGRSVKKRLRGVAALNPGWKGPYVADIAPNLSSAASMAAIRIAIGETQASLIIIDTLSASFEGDDSSQQDAAVVIRNLKKLSEALNCLVVFVHHTRKDGGSFRGSGVLKNDVDAVLEITTEGSDQLRVHCARVEKNRDGEQGARYPFRLLRSEPLGWKPNGKAVTTCTVVHADEGYGTPASVPKSIQTLRTVFAEMQLEGPVTVGRLLAEVVKQDSTLSDAKARATAKYNLKEALRKHLNLKKTGELPDDKPLFFV